jgi:hypothetical protein
VRTCAKPRCRSGATVSAALRYAEREVLVGALSTEPDPGLVDLCSEHAGRLTPPIGWRIVEARDKEPLRA